MKSHLVFRVLLIFVATACGGGTVSPERTDGGSQNVADAGGETAAEAAASLRIACSLGGGAGVASVSTDLACVNCQAQQACDPFGFSKTYASIDACITRSATLYAHAMAAPGVNATAASYETCATDMKNLLTCDAFLGSVLPASCTPAPGSLAQGVACGTNAQCASGYCSGSCGTCQKPPASGDSCVSVDCGPGLVCATDGSCRPFGKVGEACLFRSDCARSLACIGGKCEPARQKGQSCDFSPSQDTCDALHGLACDAQTKTCIEIQLSTTVCANQNTASGVPDQCSAGFYCSINDSPPGRCTMLVPDGASCASSNPVTTPPSCAPPAFCANGTCVLFDPAICK